MKRSNKSQSNDTVFSWLMVALLAVIALVYFLLEGQAQTNAITVVLIAGLVLIAASYHKSR